jgi:hypothetical protein
MTCIFDGDDTFLRNVGSQDLHGVTSQKTAFFIVAAFKTSNLTKWRFLSRKRRNPAANRLEAILCFKQVEGGGAVASLFILSDLMVRQMAQARRMRTCFPVSCKFLNCFHSTLVFVEREREREAQRLLVANSAIWN